jgi:hypothetical protein
VSEYEEGKEPATSEVDDERGNTPSERKERREIKDGDANDDAAVTEAVEQKERATSLTTNSVNMGYWDDDSDKFQQFMENLKR